MRAIRVVQAETTTCLRGGDYHRVRGPNVASCRAPQRASQRARVRVSQCARRRQLLRNTMSVRMVGAALALMAAAVVDGCVTPAAAVPTRPVIRLVRDSVLGEPLSIEYARRLAGD